MSKKKERKKAIAMALTDCYCGTSVKEKEAIKQRLQTGDKPFFYTFKERFMWDFTNPPSHEANA